MGDGQRGQGQGKVCDLGTMCVYGVGGGSAASALRVVTRAPDRI